MVAVEKAAETAATPSAPTKVASAKPPADGDSSLNSYATALPICVVRDAKGAMAFYESGLGATVSAQYPSPNGKIMHAYLKAPLGRGFEFALEDDGCMPELVETSNVEAVKEGATRAGGLYLYVTVGAGEVDGVVEKMREAGAVVTMDCKDMIPYGIAWSFASIIKPSGETDDKADKEGAVASKEDEPAKEAAPVKEATPAKEAEPIVDAEPAKEAQPEATKEADAPAAGDAPMEEEKKE